MNIINGIIAKKKTCFLYPRHAAQFHFMNHYLKPLDKKIDCILDKNTVESDFTSQGCEVLLVESLSRFNLDDIAIFVSAHISDDVVRQFHHFGMLLNHHYFFIEALTLNPVKENYQREDVHAPWAMDGEFMTIYNKIVNNTLVDIVRCYELKSLLEQTAHLDGDILEVGVRHGGTGFLLASYGAKYGKKAYLADTFRGFVNSDQRFDRGAFNSPPDRPTYKQYAEQLFASSALDNYMLLEGSFPEETGDLVASEKFCFCHIDTDVYWALRNPTEWIWDKLAVGGVIVYDDYGFNQWEGATYYVDEIAKLKDRLFIYNINGHGIIVKLQ